MPLERAEPADSHRPLAGVVRLTAMMRHGIVLDILGLIKQS
jgi:hypothetical protein